MRRYPGDPDVSGPAVLAALRANGKMHFMTLCSLLGVRGLTNQGTLIKTLGELHAQGLIIADNPYFGGWECDATVELSTSVRDLTQVLGLSIKELSERDPQNSVVFRPFFGKPVELPTIEASVIFVLMPFRAELEPIYSDHIKIVAKKLKLTVKRGDDFFSAHDIMRDIWNGICNAKVIIADCTDRNPNVFYEIGIAHTVGKPVILITQNSEDVPFDLRSIRFIKYEYTPRGMKAFEKLLQQTIKEVVDAMG